MNPKKIKFARRSPKRLPKRKPPTKPSKVYCKKDIYIVVSASDNIDKEYEGIFEKEYFGKYPKGGKPYGCGTGISFKEWDQDRKRLRDIRFNMHKDEVERLSDLVCNGWIRNEEAETLNSKVPTPLKDLIASYADTQVRIGYEYEFQKYYEEE